MMPEFKASGPRPQPGAFKRIVQGIGHDIAPGVFIGRWVAWITGWNGRVLGRYAPLLGQ
jgi:hypothetical protein